MIAGSGIGAVGANIWAKFIKDSYFTNVKLVLDSYPQSYVSFKTGQN